MDQRELDGIEAAWFAEDLGWNRELSDVVDRRCHTDAYDQVGVEAYFLGLLTFPGVSSAELGFGRCLQVERWKPRCERA